MIENEKTHALWPSLEVLGIRNANEVQEDTLNPEKLIIKSAKEEGLISMKLHLALSSLSGLAANESDLCLQFSKAEVTCKIKEPTKKDKETENKKKRTPQLELEELKIEIMDDEVFLVRTDLKDEKHDSSTEGKNQLTVKDLLMGEILTSSVVTFKAKNMVRDYQDFGEEKSQLRVKNLQLNYRKEISKANRTDIKLHVNVSIDSIETQGSLPQVISQLYQDLSDMSSFKIYTMERRASVSLISFISGHGLIIPCLDFNVSIKSSLLKHSSFAYQCKIGNANYEINQNFDSNGIIECKVKTLMEGCSGHLDDTCVFNFDNFSLQETLRENLVDIRSLNIDLEKTAELSSSLNSSAELGGRSI